MIEREFKSKAEVIAFVTSLGIEEAILLGNLWLEIKNKVTALEQNEIIAAAKIEKEKAILVCEQQILETKNKEVKSLKDSVLIKDALILDKENEIKRWSAEINKLQGDKDSERTLQREKIIEMQSYIRAKEEELAKTRIANENFMMNKFEVTFGRFIEKSKTSAGTGLIGEEFVEQILSKIGYGIHYENVARWGHQGDFKIMFPKSQVTILLEVKNFAGTQTSLPKKDIDKFFMDLNEASYHAGILLSLNSQCKMDTEDLCIQDDPKSKKKYMFISKFVSMVKGDHDFTLKLALNVMANAVHASRTNQDDTSKEMLSFIKSQLEFMKIHYKAAQVAEKEAAKTVMSFRDNINRITRQITDWENPKRPNRVLSEFQDQPGYISPSKRNTPFIPHQTKENQAFGILAQPVIARPNSPWDKRNIVTGESSPKTPKLNTKRPVSSNEINLDYSTTPDKLLKNSSDKNAVHRSKTIVNGNWSPHTNMYTSPSIKKDEAKQPLDDHGFLKFPCENLRPKKSNGKERTPESQLILPDDTDDIFKNIQT